MGQKKKGNWLLHMVGGVEIIGATFSCMKKEFYPLL